MLGLMQIMNDATKNRIPVSHHAKSRHNNNKINILSHLESLFLLTLKVLITTAAEDIFMYFFFVSRIKMLTLHVNSLPSR